MSKIGALRAKITHNFWGSNQHELGKKWAQNAPFASIFQKFSRGRPPGPPPAGGGLPLPHPPPAALRADLVTPPPAVDPLDPPLRLIHRVLSNPQRKNYDQ